MQTRSIISAGLLLACVAWNLATAQVVSTGRIGGLPTFGGGNADARQGSYPEPRPYGSESKPLPGLRVVDASKIQGKWLYRETRNNVLLDGVRVPKRVTSLALELKDDGSYTLDYQVYWGTARSNDPEAQQAGLIVKEKGRFSVSGSVLLLEAEPLEIIRQGKFERTQEALPADKRAHVARLDGAWLNLAGPCRPYQVEAACTGNPTVWFSLLKEGVRAFGHR